MEIIQTAIITLSDDEKRALQTIIDAHNTCISNDCFTCGVCPLCTHSGVCLGLLCKEIKERINKDDNRRIK